MKFLLKQETASERNHTVKSMKHRVLDLDLDAATFCVYEKRTDGRVTVCFTLVLDVLSNMKWQPWAQCSDDDSPLAHYIDLHLMNF